VSLSQDDHVIEAFAPDAAQKSLAHRIHQGSLNRFAQNANPGPFGDTVEDRAELVVTIANDELRALPERRHIAELLRRSSLRRCRGTSSSTPGIDPHRRHFIPLSRDALE